MGDAPIAVTNPPEGYLHWLADLKARIYATQQRAALAVNTELLQLYWQIGHEILTRQAEQGWGTKVVERLAHDLRAEFPEMSGFSRSNLLYMRTFAEAWTHEAIVQQPVGQLPWGHNLVLLTKLKDRDTRLAYAQAAVHHGWSRNVLTMHIESRLLDRQGAALRNFDRALPAPQSDLARESLKDPYRLDFLGLVVELKAGKFKPEHIGQLGFYMTAVDAQVKDEADSPTIGLLLCKSKDKVVAEYALRDTTRPLGVAEYQLAESLPESLQTSLPTIEQIERELEGGAT